MTVDKPKISIIVPIYNVGDYLEKCIISIITQTYTNLQIILIDDGSTDISGDICEDFIQRDQRIEVYHTINKGLVAARKFGLEKAKGEYIGFVDGDDYIEPDMFFSLLENIVECDADFVHSGYIKENNGIKSINCSYDENVIETSSILDKEKFLCKYVLDKMSVSPSIWSKLFKADFIKRCYQSLPDMQQYGEDMICLFRCVLESHRISLSKKAMYHYIVREGSLSNLSYNGFVIKEISLWNQILNVFEEYGCFERIAENICMFFQKCMLSVIRKRDGKELHVLHYFFQDIEQLIGKKIVIYGAGKVGKDYYTQICQYKKCDIIAWVDSNWSKYHFEFADVISAEELWKLLFDVVVIAVNNKQSVKEIRDTLINMGISHEKIIWLEPGEY